MRPSRMGLPFVIASLFLTRRPVPFCLKPKLRLNVCFLIRVRRLIALASRRVKSLVTLNRLSVPLLKIRRSVTVLVLSPLTVRRKFLPLVFRLLINVLPLIKPVVLRWASVLFRTGVGLKVSFRLVITLTLITRIGRRRRLMVRLMRVKLILILPLMTLMVLCSGVRV